MWFADAEGLIVSFVPVESTPVTVITSESISIFVNGAQGRGATRLMVVLPEVTAAASEDMFAAEATSEPCGKLLTFCVRAALTLTLTF